MLEPFYAHMTLTKTRAGILTSLSIGYAFRLGLRTRLTLGRRSLPRKPWTYGGAGFHRPKRYLCLHPHFHGLHGFLPKPLQCPQNAPLPLCLRTIQNFGTMLDRQLFSAQDLSMSQLLRTV